MVSQPDPQHFAPGPFQPIETDGVASLRGWAWAMGEAESVEGVVRGRVPAAAAPAEGGRLGLLALGALGVVYGDIGTSPLYALEQCVAFVGEKGLPIRTMDVLGILSLIFWALTLVVSVKYLGVIMRADNRGEGGILALLALV